MKGYEYRVSTQLQKKVMISPNPRYQIRDMGAYMSGFATGRGGVVVTEYDHIDKMDVWLCMGGVRLFYVCV